VSTIVNTFKLTPLSGSINVVRYNHDHHTHRKGQYKIGIT